MNFEKPLIMGVLNLTPDSFSDGGKFNRTDLAERRLLELIEQGADIIDIGGESTGPGAPEVSKAEELNRVKSIIDLIAEKKWSEKAIFSIDTYKAAVAKYALQHGFKMVNDVTALRGDPEMLSVLVEYQPHVILMYSKDSTARTTRDVKAYEDVVDYIKNFLKVRTETLLKAGFPRDKIILDPGMGAFVSTIPEYSFEIIKRLKEFDELGFPLLIGISRKSCLGGKLEERDPDSVKWSLKAIENGAKIIRIHNVELIKKALR